MLNARKWQTGPALLITGLMTTSSVAPLVISAPAFAQSRFYDVQQGYWAQTCIEQLAQRNIISGYPDGSFRPNSLVTRAEFSAMVGKAFPNAAQTRSAMQFSDVPTNYWAYSAIRQASQTGFLSGYPNGTFVPTQNIPRAQVLVSLASGLGYSPTGSASTTLDAAFDDASSIPDYADNAIAAATQRSLVVNYPNSRLLNPNQSATRADVAASICQALTGPGQASLIPSQYIASTTGGAQGGLTAGTSIPVEYRAERIIVAPNETVALTLTVAEDVENAQGTVLIPEGSQVVGQLQPANGGSQFVARELIINNQRYPISATSEVVTETRSVRGRDFKSILGGAAIGAGAAAGIATITGERDIDVAEVLTGAGVGAGAGASRGRPATSIIRDTAAGAAVGAGIAAITGDKTISLEEALGGAAAGATIGGIVDRPASRVVVIDSDEDLTLTLNSDLTTQR